MLGQKNRTVTGIVTSVSSPSTIIFVVISISGVTVATIAGVHIRAIAAAYIETTSYQYKGVICYVYIEGYRVNILAVTLNIVHNNCACMKLIIELI